MSKEVNRAALYFHTIRYLKPEQILWRIYYQIWKRTSRRNFLKRCLTGSFPAKASSLKLSPGLTASCCCIVPRTFVFLGYEKSFRGRINFNFTDAGKLWAYHLNYFDWLNQPGMDARTGLDHIREFIAGLIPNSVGLEPYPISLRVINWIKFCCRHEIDDQQITNSLAAQFRILQRSLEYHLLGNHLLENGFAMIFGAYYLNNPELYRYARKILLRELKVQILSDGMHFELSPMYHRILLHRLLDCINLASQNSFCGDAKLMAQLHDAAARMRGAMTQLSFGSGEMPLFNDAADGMAPDVPALHAYADSLGIAVCSVPLGECGYRKIRSGCAELIVDVGKIGPDYLPGHAHADTLSFELAIDGCRMIVDSGVSTYEPGAERLRQRGTSAHNTVEIDGEDSSEVWGSFRVARRAKPFGLSFTEEDDETILVRCTHDGYRRLPGHPVHWREWRLGTHLLKIHDVIHGEFKSATGRIHFHPSVVSERRDDQHFLFHFPDGPAISCTVIRGYSRLISDFYHPAFGVSVLNPCLEIKFGSTETEIVLNW